ncbi:1,2-dihydroxy-3-keto-5-methylthiopentene dioxygenase [Paludibacterium yongneupense]|uniref:1,2-dihydroxy-3-keto-5-methylthiopentene dioxygenase n=1 Tax=Paludibacterium yongneupense TaxID=400061 RepID=UPI000405C1F6|nr:hypothetical protein [Paludibacterium yongneupense]
MTTLIRYRDDAPQQALESSTDGAVIIERLAALGVGFERWSTSRSPLPAAASADAILAAYAAEIARLREQGGYTTADVVRLTPDHPEREALRGKFIEEHTHSEDEVRFFVEGGGAFYLHIGDSVYQLLCERGDLLRVPANARHWFDMGPRPRFTAIRLFTDPAGWVGHFTGDGLSARFPRYGEPYAGA